MPIDPSAVGASTEAYETTWTSRDCLIYALGVGAGVADLAYTTENTSGTPQRVLPTMPVTLSRDARALKLIGDFDWTKLVHAEQYVAIEAPLPVAGTISARSRVDAVYDKGRAALVEISTDATDVSTGQVLFRTGVSLFLGGEGGWGGQRGPASDWVAPSRPPDATVHQTTSPEQALLYRLSGDRNRLHSDPAIAVRAGFDRPILHGLCTFGFAGRALLATVCGGDPARFASMRGRFSAPVLPGEVLQTRIWYDSAGAAFQTSRADGTVVITAGRLVTR